MDKCKVLLVEDSDIARLTAELNLKSENCEVEIDTTGSQAIDLASSKKYDIILMDIGLGDTDGFAVTQAIRNLSTYNKSTPIIALTAHDTELYHEKAKEVGMNDYLTKPLENAEIQKILKKYASSTA